VRQAAAKEAAKPPKAFNYDEFRSGGFIADPFAEDDDDWDDDMF
jgi:hypothetical protein